MNSSEDLVARLRDGDDEAFRLIFERYARSIFRFIYGMVGQRDLAEELTQETFMGAYKNIRSLRDAPKFSSWLYSIARNVTHKSLRSRRGVIESAMTDSTTINEISIVMRTNSHQVAPDRHLLSKERHEAILSALSTLDEDKRLAFTLKVLEQKSYQEIAEITGYSIPKLKTDVHRAKVEMRRMLRPFLEVSDEL
ncbi:MAG: RNA polymerase sigma factor [Pyrinomonadaceae bacterium]